MTPRELVELLDGGTVVNRVGIVLIASADAASLKNRTLVWGATPVDIVDLWLESLPKESRYADLTSQRFLRLLETIGTQTYPRQSICLLYIDLILAGMAERDRATVWQFLFSSFKKYPTSILLALPRDAERLLSPRESSRWRESGRLCDAPSLAVNSIGEPSGI